MSKVMGRTVKPKKHKRQNSSALDRRASDGGFTARAPQRAISISSEVVAMFMLLCGYDFAEHERGEE
jgi:hypothetical protein